MSNEDAALLPPSSSPSSEARARSQERDSARHLEHVGVEAVLGAMIEQKRRASQPSFPPYEELEGDNDPRCDDPTQGADARARGRL